MARTDRLVTLRHGAGLEAHVGDDDRQHQFVGDDHQHHADARRQPQLTHDRNVDQHDHAKAQRIHQQRQRTRDEDFAEGRVGRILRAAARQDILLPGVGHLHRMGHADREDQEGTRIDIGSMPRPSTGSSPSSQMTGSNATSKATTESLNERQ